MTAAHKLALAAHESVATDTTPTIWIDRGDDCDHGDAIVTIAMPAHLEIHGHSFGADWRVIARFR